MAEAMDRMYVFIDSDGHRQLGDNNKDLVIQKAQERGTKGAYVMDDTTGLVVWTKQ